VRLKPEEIQFRHLADNAPETALLAGDPNQPGIYVQRNRFPPGVFSLPHAHGEDRHVVVLKGTWWTGTGETFDPAKAIPLGPGSYMLHPAGKVHWDGAKDEETIVQITGVGPSSTKFVHPDEGRYTSIQEKKKP
jgi:quercetin dioxygenase-like cupin family protein